MTGTWSERVSVPSHEVPEYDQLASDDGLRHSWGLWGPGDTLGTLNLITPEATRRGLACARRGAVFSLNLPMHLPDPPLFARSNYVNEFAVGTNNALNDMVSNWNPQGSSQWDGFRHVMWSGHGHYNGVPSEQHGVHNWAERPMVTRAVLADVGRWREAQGRPIRYDAPDLIEPGELVATLDDAHVTVEPGDILLVRTGWLEWYLSLDQAGRRRAADPKQFASPGLSSREDTARLLWNLHIAAVAADNAVLETWPQGAYLPLEERVRLQADPRHRYKVALHARLLPALGLPVGELWALDSLATDCAADGTYTMCLTSAPMNMIGAAASPANAIAIK